MLMQFAMRHFTLDLLRAPNPLFMKNSSEISFLPLKTKGLKVMRAGWPTKL
jgi:hypothetical protein